SAQDCLIDFECIHQCDCITRESRWLSITNCLIGQKSRRSISAQMRNNHAISFCRENRCDIHKTVNVVRPAMQQNYGMAICRTCFCIANVQKTCIDLFDCIERSAAWQCLLPLRVCKTKLRCCNRYGSRCKKASAAKIDFIWHDSPSRETP